MSFVAEFEPRALWAHFDHILTLPRASGEETRVRRYVLDVAARRELPFDQDAAGNVVVRKPGSAGAERTPVVVLQSHLDMVNEKRSDVAHDFARDALEPQRAGEYLTASGTTLGADNGIGVAAMLAVVDAQDLVHGPLELLFTVDEETGLTGARQLEPALLTGKRLLNLDSEEEGILYIGCAGGGDSILRLPLRTVPGSRDRVGARLRVHGLKGGHSGAEIHLQRGNAIRLLSRLLLAGEAVTPLEIGGLEGGGARNAIPREALATLRVPPDRREAWREVIEAEFSAAREELRAADPEAALAMTDVPAPKEVWEPGTARAAVRLLAGLPHGVLAMSADLPGLVETSANLATVGVGQGVLVVGTSSRSSVDSALAATRLHVRAVAELAGATVEEPPPYPGWKPDMDSPLLQLVREVHRREFGKDPEVRAIHAGLECGIIGKKVPGVDMISFGPRIEFAHSPDERVHVPSVGRFWQLLRATLAALGAPER